MYLFKVDVVFVLNWYYLWHNLWLYLLLLDIVFILTGYCILTWPGRLTVPLYGILMVLFFTVLDYPCRGCILEELLILRRAGGKVCSNPDNNQRGVGGEGVGRWYQKHDVNYWDLTLSLTETWQGSPIKTPPLGKVYPIKVHQFTLRHSLKLNAEVVAKSWQILGYLVVGSKWFYRLAFFFLTCLVKNLQKNPA